MVVALRDLASFGGVAAEDDAVLEYFLTTDAVEKISANQTMLVLGRKGAGKTAIVRHFTEGEDAPNSKSLNLRGYPWNAHAQRIDRGASDIEAYVSSWRYLIAVEFASMVLQDAQRLQHNKVADLQRFFRDNYGSSDPSLGELLRPKTLKIKRVNLQPSVLGNQLGSVDLDRETTDMQLGAELNALSESILRTAYDIVENEELRPYVLHFDELDQGLSAKDESRNKMLIGLILAARDVRRESNRAGSPLLPVVYLRSDLWDDLEFSDKNKISQTLAYDLNWTGDALFELIGKRIKSRLGEEAEWEDVASNDLMRGSQTKWNHILARTFMRPRDVIRFLNAALEEAKKREDYPLVLINQDIVGSREQYSAYLKEELDDEILPHWKYWEQALQACSAISTITFERDDFFNEYESRKTKDNKVGPLEALELLYRFSVIGYARRSGYGGSSWAFQYADPQAGWDNGASQFKVHLGLKEFAKLREERK